MHSSHSREGTQHIKPTSRYQTVNSVSSSNLTAGQPTNGPPQRLRVHHRLQRQTRCYSFTVTTLQRMTGLQRIKGERGEREGSADADSPRTRDRAHLSALLPAENCLSPQAAPFGTSSQLQLMAKRSKCSDETVVFPPPKQRSGGRLTYRDRDPPTQTHTHTALTLCLHCRGHNNNYSSKQEEAH